MMERRCQAALERTSPVPGRPNVNEGDRRGNWSRQPVAQSATTRPISTGVCTAPTATAAGTTTTLVEPMTQFHELVNELEELTGIFWG